MDSIIGGGCWKEAKDETDGGAPLKHDPDFKGPIRGKSRRPKDLLCLAVFLAFIVGMVAIAIVAWVDGEPERLIYPTDSRGRLCGVHDDVKDRPYLLFFDIRRCATVVSISELISGDVDTDTIFTCPTQQVCVDECPDSNSIGVRDNPVCVDEVNTTMYQNVMQLSIESPQLITELLQEIADERCAPYYLQSIEVARRCIPTVVDLEGIVNDTLTFDSDDLDNNQTIGDLVTSVNIDAIVNGSFTQALLVEARQFLLDVYRDLSVVWPALLIGVAVTMGVSFLYILLMWCFAPVIVWLSIIAAPILILIISAFSYYQFYCFQNTEDIFNNFNTNSTTLTEFLNTTEAISNRLCVQTEVFRTFISSQLPWFRYQKETWLAVGIIGTVFVLIIVLILIFLGKQIRISIAIIQEAAKAVGGVPTSVFYPVLTWLLLIILFLYWAVVAVFLLTASTPTYRIMISGTLSEEQRTLTNGSLPLSNGSICDIDVFTEMDLSDEPTLTMNVSGVITVTDGSGQRVGNISCMFDEFVTSNTLLGMQIYHLFGLLWIGNYILALGECTLAGAFASWYWAFKKPRDVPFFAVLGSLGRALLFHSGSLAFGAIIIAIIQMIRFILGYLQKKLKGRTGRIAKIILCVMQCCFWLLEKVFRYINRQAYIEIAIYGYDFCTGACKAIKLMLRNILTTAVKDRIVAFLLFLGKIVIVSVIGILAYLGFGPYQDQGRVLWSDPLNYYLLPVIILILVAYFIASGFLSVFHMAVDTIFICALEDYERNDGSAERPYFMSKNLKKLLGVKNKFEHTDGDDSDGGGGGEELRLERVPSAEKL
jgi:choline transporter-like protein 2/4/5